MNRTLIFCTGFLGVVLFVATTILGGLQFQDYSHGTQFISESYAIGTPHGVALRFWGFLPSGLLLALFAFALKKVLRGSRLTNLGLMGVGVFYGIATVVVSIFPCDAGCNKEMIDPSAAQLIHNLTGMLTYLIVPPALLAIGVGLYQKQDHNFPALTSIACGVLSFLFVLLLISGTAAPYFGLVQRLIEGSILVWFVLVGWYAGFGNKTA
ncbi:MAG: DUF998 domain-containing protein [Lewinellaceae bacterium]|nr:DUF998 domain-containing protein [Lewinellaceae bacterium]